MNSSSLRSIKKTLGRCWSILMDRRMQFSSMAGMKHYSKSLMLFLMRMFCRGM